MIDLGPAAARMTGRLASIDENRLGAPTPCPDSSVGDLVDHVGSLTRAFTAAARKEQTNASGPPPPPQAANLEPGWKDRIARDLDALAEAWRAPGAEDGLTRVGGLDLPASIAAVIALDELVVHGWDIAVATGQPYDAPAEEVETAMATVASFDAPRDGRLFGPVVPVDESARPLERLLGLTGRDPGWQPAR